MKKIACLLAMLAAASWTGAFAQSEEQSTDETKGHLYLGASATSLALDNDRVPGVPTSSPGHSSKLGGLLLGYQFDDYWAADLSIGTDMSDNVDVDAFAVNGYRYFGSGGWRPYVSAGLSSFSIDDAPDDSSEQAQAGFGLSGQLNRNLELRVGYQSFFTISGDSYQDNALGAALAWHFREPEPTPVAQTEPQPETVAPEKEVVETVELRVQFDFDKSTIKSAYEPQFQDLADALAENPDKSITIEGHTCWIGTEEYNQGLSERRAASVKQKLVDDYGIDPARLDTVGYGESRPVADNNTLEGRRKNRRAIAVIMQTRTVTE
ncbi:MAG TPA: OmpA family protein [Arenicellales bacterium]|nr:OmpA family protein [Arenicellales bacterium]